MGDDHGVHAVRHHSHQLFPAKNIPEVEEEKEDAAAAARFAKSLSELKDLRSQLRHAADHCELAFLKSTEKKLLVESTKEYICRAVVTAVDHLGSVSANLDGLLLRGAAGASGTARRLELLAQRVLTWREYAVTAGLSRARWVSSPARYAPRYISRWPFHQVVDGYPLENTTPPNSKKEGTRLETLLALEASPDKDKRCLPRAPSLADAGPIFSTVLPISEGHSIFVDPISTSFNSQIESVRVFGSDSKEKKKMRRKLVKGNYLLTLVRSRRYSLS